MRHQPDHARSRHRRILPAVIFVSALIGLPEAKPAPAPPARDTPPVSRWERLLVADPSLPFNGSGSMRAAFGTKSGGYAGAVKKKARALGLNLADPEQKKRAEAAAQADLDGERLALIAWAKSPAARKAYESDAFRRDATLASKPLTVRFLNDDGSVKIKSIIEARCVRCHSADVGGSGSSFSLETYDDIARYTRLEKPKP